MKAGIITYHRSINYGAFLQAYALAKILKGFELEIEIIDFNTCKSEEKYRPKSKNPIKYILHKKRVDIFKKSLEFLPLSKESLISDNIKEFNDYINNRYDIIIAGSDEIWRTDTWRGFPNPYWLNGITGTKKISYAVSSRCDLSKLSKEKKEFIRKSLSDYMAIGIRDQYSLDELKRLLDYSCELKLCCDPTFLIDLTPNPENGRKILSERYHINPQNKIIGVMMSNKALTTKLRQKYKGRCELISLYHLILGYKNAFLLNPFEWIDVISCLDVFITSYFHGTCFAINADVQFISVDIREDDVVHSKIYDILSRNNMLDRFFNAISHECIHEILSLCDQYLYDTSTKTDFAAIVNRERQMGMKFLNTWLPKK